MFPLVPKVIQTCIGKIRGRQSHSSCEYNDCAMAVCDIRETPVHHSAPQANYMYV